MTDIPNDTDNFRIAVYSHLEDITELSEVFQQVLELHPIDAKVWCRQLPGVLNAEFSEERARALTAAISRMGIRVIAIPSADVPHLRHALTVHHAQCGDNGLQIKGLRDEPEITIPWPAIQMVCVGEIPLEGTRHFSSGAWSGISAGHHYQTHGIDVPNTPCLEVWITCASPFPNLHIDHEQMNYEYLGTRRVDSATVNFKQFIQDLTGRAAGAVQTESTFAYLQHVEPERFRFKSEDDLIRYATLHALETRESSGTHPSTATAFDHL